MPCWISNAVNKLCHADLRFSLSRLWFSLLASLRFSLKRLYGIAWLRCYGLAYRVTDSRIFWSALYTLLGGLMAFLTALAAVLFGVILAVLIG